jgi:MFS superfamily sulfate permease-like transporter
MDDRWLHVDLKRSSPLEGVKTKCKKFDLKRNFYSLVPLADRLRNYNCKQDLMADLIAGVTVAIMQIPQGIAYALLVGITPNYGLYTSFFPVLIYAFLGTAQHISLGTMAVVDIMLRDIVSKYRIHPQYSHHRGNSSWNDSLTTDAATGVQTNTSISTPVTGLTEDPIEILTSLCLLVGLFQIAFGLLRLGAVSLILSDQLISGFSCGASINVIMSQIPPALGVRIPDYGGPLSLVYVSCITCWFTHVLSSCDSCIVYDRPSLFSFSEQQQFIEICKKIVKSNVAAVILTIVVLVVSVTYKVFLEGPLSRKVPFPIPIDLLIVSVSF